MAKHPTPLTPELAACLACIAGHMIPASAALSMPSAADPAIMADASASLERDADATCQVLRRVDAEAGGRLVSLDPAARADLLARLRAELAAEFALLETVVSRAYYRDPRVLTVLGLNPQPPFPEGYAVEAIDPGLLAPVIARGEIWRKV